MKIKNSILIIIFVLISSTIVMAGKKNIDDIKANILGTIAKELTGMENPGIYVEGIHPNVLVSLENRYTVVTDCLDADLAIISSKSGTLTGTCSELPVFVNDSEYYQRNVEQNVGWFYWKKGRPNISIQCDKLEQLNLHGHVDEKYCE